MSVELKRQAAGIRHWWRRGAAALRLRNDRIMRERVNRELEGQPEEVVDIVMANLPGQMKVAGVNDRDFYSTQVNEEKRKKKVV